MRRGTHALASRERCGPFRLTPWTSRTSDSGGMSSQLHRLVASSLRLAAHWTLPFDRLRVDEDRRASLIWAAVRKRKAQVARVNRDDGGPGSAKLCAHAGPRRRARAAARAAALPQRRPWCAHCKGRRRSDRSAWPRDGAPLALTCSIRSCVASGSSGATTQGPKGQTIAGYVVV